MTRFFHPLFLPLLLLGLFACFAQPSFSQTGSGEAPLVIEAEKALEWDQTNKFYRASGEALAEQGDQRITADIITAFYEEAGEDRDITRIEATGQVVLVNDGQTARGPRLDYELDSGSWQLSGGPASLTTADGLAEAGQSITYLTQKREVVLLGAGRITLQDGRLLQGDKLIVLLDEEDAIDQILGEGNVRVRQPNGQLATADKADYRASSGTALLTGRVQMRDGRNILNGNRAEIDFNEGVNRMLPGPSGRVTGRLVLSGGDG